MINYEGQSFGKYRLLSLLGCGGTSDVYLGEHILLGTKAAIKILHSSLTPEERKEFHIEAKVLAHLDHPNIIRTLDFDDGSEKGIPFLIMEYAQNGSLRNHHPKGSRLPLDTIVFYVKQVAAALQYIHERNLIHRDVKPGNMLLASNNTVRLSDVGIAVVADREISRTPQSFGGTPAYMAPEQSAGQACFASDQYSLGIVVYEWLCGVQPFQGDEGYAIMGQHMRMEPPSLCTKLPIISPEVEQVVKTALAKDPGQRFEHVRAFALALEEASKSGPPLPSKSTIILPPPSTPPASPGLQRQRTSYPVVGLLDAAPFVDGVVAGGKALTTDNAPHPKNTGNADPTTPIPLETKDNSALAPASSVPPAAHISPSGASPAQVSATNGPTRGSNPDSSNSDLPPKQPRIAGDLAKAAPAAPAVPLQVSPVNSASRQPSSGRTGALDAAPAAGAGAGILAGRAARGGGAPPIVRGTPSGARRSGTSQGRGRFGWLIALTLLLLAPLLCSGMAFALPRQTQALTLNVSKMVGNLVNPQPSSSSPTVTITPASQVVENNYSIQAVTSGASATQHQVAARVITATPSQQKTVTAIGHVKVNPAPAKGVVTFTNGSFSPYTYGTNTPIEGNGVTFYLDAPVTIPAAIPRVSFGTATGHVTAATPGSKGNIGPGVINIQGQDIAITNEAAFSGGQDDKDYMFVRQSDFDAVANSLKAAVLAQAKSGIQSQIRSTERAATALQCTSPTASANQPIGDTSVNVTSATVTALASCTQEVYDQQGLQTLVEGLLKAKASADSTLAGYALVGSIVTDTKVQGVDNKGTVTLGVDAKGMWVYQLDQNALAKLIAGLSADQARAALQKQPGVAQVSIPEGITSFPSDTAKFTITIVPVPGFSGGGSVPTVTPGTAPPSTPTGQPGGS